MGVAGWSCAAERSADPATCDFSAATGIEGELNSWEV